MRIAIRDTTDSHTVGFFDNKAGIKFKSAEMTQFLKGACSFVTIKYRSKDAERVRAGCKLAFRHKGKDYWLTINEFNKQGTEVEITAYSLSLEANKEKRGAYKASRAMSIVDYFSVFDPEKSLEIGINEVSDKKLTLEWTGTDTVLARLYSIANSFDAELEFVTELNPNYSLKRHVVNIYRSGNLGGDSTGRPVRVGTELKVLGFNSNINDLYTAIDVTGKDGLKLPDKTIKDSNGEVQFFSKNGRLYAPQARDKFPSNKVNVNDGYILAEAKTTDYANQEALFGYALSEMKKHCDVQVEYSTEGAVKGSVGDTKTLIDSINFEPTLYVQARITEQTEDLETGKSLKTTFSNFKRTSSQLSNDLTKKIEELAKSAVPYRIVMVTSNGTSFKNGTGQSIVRPKLFKGDVEITDATYRFNFNNNTVAGLNYTVNASAVNGTSVLKIDAYVGNDVVASDELTFINVNDGSKGADGNGIASSVVAYQAGTSATVAPTGTWSSSPVSVPAGQYLWTRTIFTYTDTTTKTIYNVSRQGVDGAKGADGIAGKDGVGISSTVITYGLSANETTQPTTWTANPPTLVKGQYLWTKTVWTYTDAKTETGYTKTYIAKDGNNGTDGIAGKDGVGILSTSITYQASTSGTTVPTGTWSSQVPSVPNGQFLWTRTVWNYTDSTSETGYSVAKMGTDGKSTYLHVAWANSADGKTDFSLTDSTGRKYRGEYADYTQTDSTDPTKYKWVDMTANIKAGNNNLLVNTKTLANNGILANNTSETYLGGTVATAIAPIGSYRETYTQVMKIAPEGNEFIVSFYAKSSIDNVTIHNHFYLPNRIIKAVASNGTVYNHATGGDGLIAIKLTTQWKRYWIKWTIRDVKYDNENVPMKVILGRTFDSVNSVSIALPALYAGNLNTEHSDAPEDTQLKIDSKADQALTQAQMLALEERSALARDNAIAEAMKNTISEVEAKWQTWYNLNTADEKQKVANDIASLLDRVAKFEQNLGEASARFEFINNETLIGEEGVAIGDKEGKAKLFLSNDSISFVTNGVAQMTLTGDTLTIKNGLFTERIQIGNYVEEVYGRNPLYNVIRPIKYS